MISTSEFRNNAKLEIDGIPYAIVEFQHVKPGKGGAFVRTKLKNLLNNSVLEKTFRAGEKFDSPNLEERKFDYLYSSDGKLCFMDNETYEQVFIDEAKVGEDVKLLKEGINVNILFYNESPINFMLPMFVTLEVAQTEPGIKGDTVSGGSKPAKLVTGAVIKVPLYIVEGDVIKVDTRTLEFVERVKSQA